MKTKTCIKCKLEKRVDEFYKKAACADGYETWCKKCRREWQDNYNKEHKEQIVKKGHEWFIEHKARKNKQARDRCRERWATDPEYRARKNAWKTEHYHTDEKFRIKKRAGDKLIRIRSGRLPSQEGFITKDEWKEICEMSNYHCMCCGRKKKLTFDHITPLDQGGTNTKENIQALCLKCNSSKSNNTTNYKKNWG